MTLAFANAGLAPISLKIWESIQSCIWSINSVLHINNWRGFIDLENFVNEVNVDWEVNVLTFPKHLDVANNNNKKEVLDLIRKTNIPNKEYVINHLS